MESESDSHHTCTYEKALWRARVHTHVHQARPSYDKKEVRKTRPARNFLHPPSAFGMYYILALPGHIGLVHLGAVASCERPRAKSCGVNVLGPVLNARLHFRRRAPS